MQNFFETKTRSNGEEFTCLTDDAPQELQNFMRELHDGGLPNDWTYETAYHLFCCISDYNEDTLYELADNTIDTSIYKLITWAAEFYNDIDTKAHSQDDDIASIAQREQHEMIYQMANQVLEFIQEQE